VPSAINIGLLRGFSEAEDEAESDDAGTGISDDEHAAKEMATPTAMTGSSARRIETSSVRGADLTVY
jgi:hypothetical protein